MNIYKLQKIETPRLNIRPVQLGDEVLLNKAVNHSLELLQKWQPWAKDASMDATRSFVERGCFAWESGDVVDFPMIIVHKTDQKIIGASGYTNRCDIHQGIYEIGYWCDRDYQGQGLVTECVNALTRYAFQVLNASKVVLFIHVDNKKSIAVAKRLNFINQGIVDCIPGNPAPHYVYSVDSMDHLASLEINYTHERHDNINSKMIMWARATLNITDDKAFASSRVMIQTPWSTVLKINTGNESVYLKHTPDLLALEPAIITMLHDEFHAPVPSIIAQNTNLNCFLMKDAGRALRVVLKEKFDIELLSKVIERFILLQFSAADHVDLFLDMGVPDWRLDKFPDLYRRFISQKDLLMAHGLLEKEIGKLEALLPKVSNLCKKLSRYSIKQSIVQSDFHDNNILVANASQDVTFIDLGEIVISHPFFSFIGCLKQIKKHHGLIDEDSAYQKLRDHVLNHYIQFESKEDLLNAFDVAHILWFIFEVFAQYRLMQACGQETIMSFQPGKLGDALKAFIAACC